VSSQDRYAKIYFIGVPIGVSALPLPLRKGSDRLSQVEGRLGPAFALRFRPGTGRAFFVVPAEAHREVLRERALRLVRNRCWSRHFELYETEGQG
jgi:hypothetical protein